MTATTKTMTSTRRGERQRTRVRHPGPDRLRGHPHPLDRAGTAPAWRRPRCPWTATRCARPPRPATSIPYSSDYEGYMANWGKHAGPLVPPGGGRRVAPRAGLREPRRNLPGLSPRRAHRDGVSRRRNRAPAPPRRRSRPLWDSALRARTAEGRGSLSGPPRPGRCGLAEPVADRGNRGDAACNRFRIENLTDAHVDSFGKIADRYGQQWTAELLRAWSGEDQPAWAYWGGQGRPQWGGGLAARPVRGLARRGQCRRGGRAAAA